MPTSHLARCARFALFALCAAPAAAQSPKPVTPVRGLRPMAALEALELDGFLTHTLRLDGVEVARADIEGAAAVVSWTVPPEWESAAPGTTIEVGFETYVFVADHVGEDASEAAASARRIGYVLVEGDPSSGTPIAATDDRVVESFHASSPDSGDLVAVGAYVGVVLIAPTSLSFGVTGALILGAVISSVVGLVGAAALLKLKSDKG
ncbi:MAG TPA: hypothetical protein VMT18_01825 [Planctomycetota bacterium]|nr:hypothetical protein [Planctomycetota bacterium]